jgi:hypothetical protein
MKRTYFHKRSHLSKVVFIGCVLLQSCNSSSSDNTSAANPVDDTISYRKKETADGSLNGLNKTNSAAAERRQMILMQIDSTYSAISLLDTAKQQLTDISPADISMAERNKRSKIIFNINIMQNELIREMDAAIVSNLKKHTNELSSITLDMKNNAAYLSTMVQQLNKVTQCISRLTNIFAEGLSRGFIKPLTPKGVPPETIKATIE